MRVRILYFGVLKELFATERESLELPEGTTVASLMAGYKARRPEKEDLLDAIAVAVNAEFASAEQKLADGDDVALLPPVSGGKNDSAPYMHLVREPISAEEFTAAIRRDEDGALVVFEGVVRNNTQGRRTLYLIYEAYEEMAERLLTELAAEAESRFGVRSVSVVHRLGKVEVGETSVLIVAASAHRAQAFDACRWAIDELKQKVPIWKKEFFADGAIWAHGDPFPAEMLPETVRREGKTVR